MLASDESAVRQKGASVMSNSRSEQGRLTDDELLHLAVHRGDFTFLTKDEDIEADNYSEGRYVQRSMSRRNRSVKQDKQWRTSQPEQSVLRYTTGG